jgi:tetratricopeptide (TPR) repeat protein
MTRLFVTFLFILLSCFSVAGDEERDSLLKSLEQARSDSARSSIFNALAERSLSTELRKSVDYSKKALLLSEKGNIDTEILQAYYNLCRAYHNLGNNNEAFTYSYKGLNLSLKLRDRNWTGRFYFQIAITYNLIEKPRQAIYYYILSRQYFEMAGLKEEAAASYINIGHSYLDLGLYDLALDFYLKGFPMIKGAERLSVYYINLGKIYAGKNEPEKALESERKALELLGEKPETVSHISIYRVIGEILIKKGELQKARQYLIKSASLAEKLNSTVNLRWICPELISLYLREGDYKNAYLYQAKLDVVKDTLHEQRTLQKIEELQDMHRTERSEQRVALLSKENEIKDLKLKRNRNIAIGLGLLLMFTIISGILLVRHNRLKEAQKSLQFEQKALRARMDPHFLFNSLNSIQKYVLSNDRETAQEYIGKFAQLIRRILDNSDKTFVTISDELETINLYLQIEQMRMRDKLEFSIRIDPAIDPYNHFMPTMLIQPYVENSIWHGIVNKKSVGTLKINVSDKGGNFLFRIEDNGIGRKQAGELKKARKQHVSSLGMKLSSERVQTLNRLTRAKISVHVSDLHDEQGQPAGTAVEINIPKTLG